MRPEVTRVVMEAAIWRRLTRLLKPEASSNNGESGSVVHAAFEIKDDVVRIDSSCRATSGIPIYRCPEIGADMAMVDAELDEPGLWRIIGIWDGDDSSFPTFKRVASGESLSNSY